MRPDTASPQLFQFNVPGLPDVNLALAQEELLSITPLGPITRLPLATAYVSGLCKWENQVIPVVDLAHALQGSPTDSGESETNLRYAITRCSHQGQQSLVAWPVLGGSRMVELAHRVPKIDTQPSLQPGMVRVSIRAEDTEIHVIRLEGLFESQ